MPQRKSDRRGISVKIKLGGDGFASHDELDVRHTLEDEIEERGIGIFHGGGSGSGWMDFSFEAENVDAVDDAIASLKKLLEEYGVLEDATIEVFDLYDQDCDDLPDFQPGDCLTFRFEDGDYGAAIVLVCPDQDSRTPSILVGVLDYKRAVVPDSTVFEGRQWLARTSKWRGENPYIVWLYCFNNIEVTVLERGTLRMDDPQTSPFFLSWENVGKYYK